MLHDLHILPQPDDVTCGPTSLHAVYQFYGQEMDLNALIREVEMLETGGTLSVFLGSDALRRGFKSTVYTYNLHVFDPVWFHLPMEALAEKLEQQLEHKTGKRFSKTCSAYLEFIRLGGQLCFDVLEPSLIKKYTCKGIPVISGLSSTYLYQSAREFETRNGKIIYDDLRGEPTGHFVVIKDINEKEVWIADPYTHNPYNSENQEYHLPVYRFLNSVMLGVITYDANLLVIEK